MSEEKPPRDTFDRWKGLVRDLGFPIVVACYFLYRDYLFTEQLVRLQAQIAETLSQLLRLHQ